MDIDEFEKQFKAMVHDALEGSLRFARIMASPGIQVTEEMKALVEAGDIAGAQKLILAEIEKQQPKADE